MNKRQFSWKRSTDKLCVTTEEKFNSSLANALNKFNGAEINFSSLVVEVSFMIRLSFRRRYKLQLSEKCRIEWTILINSSIFRLEWETLKTLTDCEVEN